MPQPLHILLAFQLNADQENRLRALSENIRLWHPEDLEESPGLIREIEIVHGTLPPENWPRMERLRWVHSPSAGVEGLVNPELCARGIALTNTRGAHRAQVAEQFFGLLLTHARRLHECWDAQKKREWNRGQIHPRATVISGRTLGLLGVGAIGTHAARVGKAFGMRVIGCRRTGRPHPEIPIIYSWRQKMDFLREADVILNTLPLTQKTIGFLGAAEFAALKPGAILANLGRGKTVDTEALMNAMGAGRLGAALLDVTDPEPLPPEHPLWAMENVYITPHYGGYEPDHFRLIGEMFIENVARYLRGDPLNNPINPEEEY